MEAAPIELKQQLDIIYRSHPILPAAECALIKQDWKAGRTVREILLESGVDPQQPIVVTLDDRLLTVAEWDTVSPDPGQLLNVKAEVMGGGGGGGSNALQIIAMIAIVVVAVLTYQYELLPAAFGMTAATTSAIGAGVIMAAGSMLVNSIFAAQIPALSMGGMSGQYGAASPTYSLSGAQNRSRPYESMPVVMGTHRFVPDNGSRPYTQYIGTEQYLYQIFNLGLSAALRSDWRIGTNPIANYKEVQTYGNDADGKLTSFPGNVDSTPGASLTKSAGWIVRTTSPNTYRIGIDIEATLYYANNSGGLDTVQVDMQVQYRPAGTTTWLNPTDLLCSTSSFVDGKYIPTKVRVDDGSYYDEEGKWVEVSHLETRNVWSTGGGIIIITGASQTPKRGSVYFDVPLGTYDVRIIRGTPDTSDTRVQNKTNWSTLRSYQLDNGDYSGQNRLGIRIRASEQLNGTIQQLSCLASAYANYSTPTGWAFNQTSNPAHWFMDFARGRRDAKGKLLYGVGLSDNQLDLAGLRAWADFCSREGLTFNAVLDQNQTAADVLTAIARAGFASPTWATGKLGAVYDERNQPPVMAFGMSNIVKGSFEVSYITEQLAEEIIVRYVNPDKDWGQDEVRVLVPGVTSPNRTSTVDLMGCTSQKMAGKFANYIAAQQYYRKRRISWESDFEGFVCQRGDVVLLSHDLTQWGYSGRLVSASGDTIKLDRTVPRNGSSEYVMVKAPDGTMKTYQTSVWAGDSDSITLLEPVTLQSGYDARDHIWFFSPLTTPGKRVKILSISPSSESKVKVVATDEDPQFYAAWDGTFNVPPQSTLLLKDVPTISNVRFSETLYRGTDNAVKSIVQITWDAVGAFSQTTVRYRVGTIDWVSRVVNDTFFQFETTQTGQLDVELLPVLGSKAGVPATASSWVNGITAAIPDVTGVSTYYKDGRTIITWRAISDARIFDYEIRKGKAWESAQVLGRITSTEFTTDGDGMYWIAAHTGSIYSKVPASMYIEGAALVQNVVAAWDEEATGWQGTLGGDAVRSGTDIVLALNGTTPPSGTYEIPESHIVDIGTAAACSVAVTYRMAADSPDNLFSAIPVFSEISSLAGAYAGQGDVKIQIAIAPDSGIFGDWQDFIPGTYYGRKFKIRAVLTSYNPRVFVDMDMLSFTVDVPDRVDTGTNVSVSAAGTNVSFAKPFFVTPNVQITIVGAKTGDDVILSGVSKTGFTVAVTDSTGAKVARSINWAAQGY